MYRELKHVFGLDDTLLDAIREALIFKRLAIDEADKGLVWRGEAQPARQPAVAIPSQPPVSEAGIAPSAATPTPPVAVSEPLIPSNGPAPSSEVISIDNSPDEPITVTEPVRHVLEAERRQLTVMFCDLVGSTDLSGKLDPEDLREVVRAYQETAAKVIEHYEGHIAQYLGDGLLVYFGYPIAHEDDAPRSVHTGLGIVKAMMPLNQQLQADYGVSLTVRIGIHTGPVVIGEMGGGGRHEQLALGETPNLAARLQGLASPNAVVVSSTTTRLLQGAFILKPLGLQDLKGVAEPMAVSRVVGPVERHRDKGETAATSLLFLAGRDEEIGLLNRRWQQSKVGLGQVVLIAGEGGIGKSALVDTLRAEVREEQFQCIAFYCSPYHTQSVLYPIIDYVQWSLAWQPDDTAATQLAKLEQRLQATSLVLQEAIPLLATLLSLSLPEDRYPAVTLSPGQQRQQTQDVLVTWLLEEAEQHPKLAVWEDIHWADPSTLELLGLLLEQTPTVPILHVLTYRPEFEPPWPTRSHLTPLTLNRLEQSQVEALITYLARGKALPREVVQHIVAKTDGVPLYVEELTKMLLESKHLREQAERYELTGSLLTVAIPDTLQDSLMARLDQMHTAKEVAQLGAAIGREFPYEMLEAITSQDEAAVQASLSQLVGAELLYQRGRPPWATYIFKHALIQDVAYHSLLKSTRQRVHQQMVEVLQTRFPEVVDMQPELLAHHCTEAGCTDQAVDYWYQAGQRAVARSANQEAISHLTKGIELLGALPKTPMRQQRELDLQVALGPVLIATKGHGAPEVECAYARAQELCQQIDNTPQLFPVLRGLILHYHAGGQTQTACRLGEQLLRLAESQPEPSLLLLAHYQLGMVRLLRGELASARTHHTRALEIYTPQTYQALTLRYGLDLGVASHTYLAWELWELGYPDQAMWHSQEAHTLAQDASHPYTLAFARVYAAVLHQFRREALTMYDQASAATTLATERGFTFNLGFGTVLQGWSLTVQRPSNETITKMHQGLAAELETGNKVMQPYSLGLLAEAYGECGSPAEGVPLLDEALSVMADTELRFYGAELYRLKGTLLLRQAVPDTSQAEDCFHAALDTARQQEARSWELRAATSLARLWQWQDKRQDAYDLLAPVYEWFTEGFATADLQEAKKLLEDLS